MASLIPLSSLLLYFHLVASILSTKSYAGNVTIYWGQNGYETDLNYTCSSGYYGIVNIAFLSEFGNNRSPKPNLAGHCDPSVVSQILRVHKSSGHEPNSKNLQNKQGTGGGVPADSPMLKLVKEIESILPVNS